MFHIAFLIILITIATGLSTMVFGFVIYIKEKNKLLRHFLVSMVLFTLLVIVIDAYYYLNYFHLLPNALPWLSLTCNLIVCMMIAFHCWVDYPAIRTAKIKAADLFFKIAAFILAVLITMSFFFYRNLFFYHRNLIYVVLLAAIIINIYFVWFEKNPAHNTSSFKWNRIPKFSVIINIIFYPVIIFNIFRRPLTPAMVGFGWLLLAATMLYTGLQLFGLTFLVRSVTKPDYQLKPIQLSDTSVSLYGLSDREMQITALLIEGLSYKSISEKLFISHETVKTHAANIYRKVGVAKKQDLAIVFHKEIARSS